MAITGTRPPTRPVSPPPATTRRQDLITAVLGLWVMVGLFVDGWAHTNLDTLDTFFTPWHGLFYTGYMAVAIWVAWLVGSRRDRSTPLQRAVPPGYEIGVIGLVVFGVGGAGDLIWHTVFGIERSIDALLSPTHVLLFVGLVMILTSPLRAVWRRSPGRTISSAEFKPALVSATLVTAVTSFFFMYAWAPTTWTINVPYSQANEVPAAMGVLEFVLSSIILFGVAAALVARFEVPRGSFVVFFGLVGLLMAGIEAFDQPLAVVPPVAAGVAMDVFNRAGRLGRDPRSTRVAFAISASLMALGVVAVAAATESVGWTPEIWGGAVLFSGLAAAAMSLLAIPYSPGGAGTSPASSSSEEG
jgi:hypothetical protein